METDILVVGAGMVGTAAAFTLLRQGNQVTLVDPRDPGEEASYGNAGVIPGSSNFQANVPRGFRELLRMLLNRTTYFRYNPAILPSMGHWLWQLWCASAPGELEVTARRSRELFARAVPEHLSMAKLAGVSELIAETGWLHITRQLGGYSASRLEQLLAKEFGIPFTILSTHEINELEPSLRAVASMGVLWNGVYHTRNPGRLTRAYAAGFTAQGGQFLKGRVNALAARSPDRWVVQIDGMQLSARNVVIAAGASSPKLLHALGYSLPLRIKRGYHQHFSCYGEAKLSRPVKDSDYGFVLAPMEQGIRLTTGVEFDFDNARASPEQLRKVLPRAQQLFPLGEPIETQPWLGHRPTFPDQLPVIGRAPNHERLWFSFGHAHWGLALGPASARLLAELMSGSNPSVDPTPYSPCRFLMRR